jgi:Domain of unknown function (DUF4112)
MEKPRTGNYRRADVDAIYGPDVNAKSASDLTAQRLWVARFLAELLDRRFAIPGTSIRIGLDPILGLVPGVGDLLANLTGSAILFIAAQFNLPKIVLLRMGLNIAVNALIGAIPVLGDIFSIWFRSNLKNVQLLERYAGGPRRTSTAADWAFVIALIAALMMVVFAILAGLVWLVSRLANFFN